MNIRGKVEQILRNHPQYRERKNRDIAFILIMEQKHRGIFDVMSKAYGPEKAKTLFLNWGKTYQNAHRSWNHLTKWYPELRGTDYDEKDKLVKGAKTELGYGLRRVNKKQAKLI